MNFSFELKKNPKKQKKRAGNMAQIYAINHVSYGCGIALLPRHQYTEHFFSFFSRIHFFIFFGKDIYS